MSDTDLVDFYRRQNSFPQSWVGGWHIGEGAYGATNLWVEVKGVDGIVTDRTVVKDTFLAIKKNAWEQQTIPDPEDPTNGRSVPLEAITMMKLRGLEQASESIVRLRNWRVSQEQKMHRLYLEHCAYGDLRGFAYNTLYSFDKKGIRVPEDYLWHCFESMTAASMLLAFGSLDQTTPNPSWELIVHRDWKLSKIFLASPLSSRYSGYHTPKLGDFGAACFIAEDDTRQKQLFPCGTPGCRPLEAVIDGTSLSSATNVWSVGFTIWALANLTEHDSQLEYDQVAEDGGEVTVQEPSFDRTTRTKYSKKLINVAERCLKYLPEDRIEIAELYKTICEHGRQNVPLREAAPNDPEFNRGMAELSNRWARGAALHILPTLKDGSRVQIPLAGDDRNSSEPGGKTGTDLTPQEVGGKAPKRARENDGSDEGPKKPPKVLKILTGSGEDDPPPATGRKKETRLGKKNRLSKERRAAEKQKNA